MSYRLLGLLACTLALTLSLSGCTVHTLEVADTQTEGQGLGFLHDGETTKEEVLTTFGSPSVQFEGERILTYRLRQDEGGQLVTVHQARGWSQAGYSLVLVFDAQHVLERHRLLKVR